MKNNHAQTLPTSRRFWLVVCLAVLALAFVGVWPQPGDAADELNPPDVPANLEVPAGHKVFLIGSAIGTQNYICLPVGDTDLTSWTFFGPQATLFDHKDKQIITHFLSTNFEEENNPLRPTWQHSRDTSRVWATQVAGGSSSDPAFVEAGAIPWLLLEEAGVESGPTGSRTLAKTTYIQRLNTSGGSAPSTPCNAGNRAFVPYEADYFFYKATKRD